MASSSGTTAGSIEGGPLKSRDRTKVGSVFVNQGLLNFERKRAAWLASNSSSGGGGGGGRGAQAATVAVTGTEVRAKNVDVEDVVDKIFSQTGNGQLPQPIPLGQMIDILIEFWEADGLYD